MYGDEIDLIEYALKVLKKEEPNEFKKAEIVQLERFLRRCINKYLKEDKMLADGFCISCERIVPNMAQYFINGETVTFCPKCFSIEIT